MTRRIALIRAGALGDTVLAIPALVMLRQRHPEVRFTAIGYPENWSIAGPLLDEILSIDDPRLYGSLWPTPGDRGDDRPARDSPAFTFDDIIAWTSHRPNPSIRHTTLVHASPHPPPSVHAAAWLLRTLSLPEDAGSIESALAVWRAALHLGGNEEGEEQRVIIHPGAGAAWKRWPPERFASLADWLAGRGYRVEVIGGPADRTAVEAMQAHGHVSFPVIRKLSPLVLAQRLSQAALYVGNDSGVTHLAAAAGAPVLALFGPTDPTSWAPFGQGRVLRACTTRTSHRGQIRVCHDPVCMSQLSTDEVLEAALDHMMRTRDNGNRGISREAYGERPKVPSHQRDR